MSDTLDPLVAASELADAFNGDAAFFARNLTTGAEIGYQAERVMPAASTIKLIVLAELFRQVECGDVSLASDIGMLSSDSRGGSGILKDLSPSLVLPVRDHATLMIALSDNTATAVLVRLLGLERIVQSAHEWGLQDTRYGFVSGADDPLDYSASTARDMARLLELVALDEIVSPAACAQMRDILLTQQYHDQIGRYLPWSQYQRAGGPLKLYSKSGFMQGVRVDAGLVDLPGNVSYVLCLMTAGSPDHSFSAEHPGAILNGRISRLIFDAWWPEDIPQSNVL